VADLLSTVAQELERVRVLGLRVEQTICAIAVRSALDSALVAELQHLDAALQHIAALRDFTEQLSVQCDDSALIDAAPALDRITLADLRARLGGADDDGGSADDGWEVL